MFRTYFHYAKFMAEPGFAQSLSSYLYFYKIKSKMMSSLDILSIKIYLLMYDEPFSLIFEEIIEFDLKNIK